MTIKQLLKPVYSIYIKLYFLINTKTSANGVRYIYRRNNSRNLIIIFSGIGAKFNYVKALSGCNSDQLFIQDCWGGGVSYYWYENKQSYPEEYTQHLISCIISSGKYTRISTIGSSKGGSAALYFGFKNRVNEIIVGACQYRVGDYLSRHQIKEHPEQWKGMIGEEPSKEWISILDNKIADMIANNHDLSVDITLLYSKEEHTYPDHMVPLIKKLDEEGFDHKDIVKSFPQHSDVGLFFKSLLIDHFARKKN